MTIHGAHTGSRAAGRACGGSRENVARPSRWR